MTTTQTTWTRDAIALLLDRDNRAVERAVLAIYRRQTADEQRSQATTKSNGMGFCAYDARFGSSLAEQLLKGSHLTPGQTTAARRMMRKYVGQLAEIANATEAAKARRAADEAAQRDEQRSGCEDCDGEGCGRCGVHHAA